MAVAVISAWDKLDNWGSQRRSPSKELRGGRTVVVLKNWWISWRFFFLRQWVVAAVGRCMRRPVLYPPSQWTVILDQHTCPSME